MNKTIQIIGDVAIDNLYLNIPQKDKGENWQLYPALHTTLLEGGTLLLSRFVREAVKKTGFTVEVYGQKKPRDLGGSFARKMIQAKVLLGKFKGDDTKDGKKEKIRVEEFYGYSARYGETPAMPPLEEDLSTVDMLILDDAGNGFREQVADFPKAIDNVDTLLIYKMSRPLARGKLWEKVCVRDGNWVLIIRANDLRICCNVDVSKAMSWERTAMEMLWQLKYNPALSELQKVPYLVILFSMDGALVVPRNPDEKPLLIFDTEYLEGAFSSTLKGQGFSNGSVFTASLCASLIYNGLSCLSSGIKEGLSAMRNLLINGFVLKGSDVDYPFDKIFNEGEYHYSECGIPDLQNPETTDPTFWRILDEKTSLSKPLVTIDIIKNRKPEILNEIPVGQYGKLQTFDRSEIEQFSAIKNLIVEYLDDPKTSRPLCIAVFGPPGAGKSFGVKQVLESLDRDDIPCMTFNISQYASYDDLIADFHKIRDIVLVGKVPIAFFDEFDCNKDSHPLGWLKYFLSPMQDGEFRERETVHPIGKSIFVFAGGTRSSFSDFELNIRTDSSENLQQDQEAIKKTQQTMRERFYEAKGPDFVSRLRGFINILGPNPNHQGCKKDSTYMIRRAKILRTTLARTEKTKQLFNSAGELQIDDSIMRAMLNIPEYRHGNRSINAIIDMSRLTGKRKFDLSALPSKDQLDMHVDAEIFLWLAARDRFFTLLPAEERFDLNSPSPKDWENKFLELIAELMYSDHCMILVKQGKAGSSGVKWRLLSIEEKSPYLDAAAEIPIKLASIGFALRKIQDKIPFPTPDITDEEIDKLAEYDHSRWYNRRVILGWKYGNVHSNIEKTDPLLIRWDGLEEKEKNKYYEAIYSILRVMRNTGFVVYRMESYDIIDEYLIKKIAMLIHEDYCKKRKAEGQTIKTNPNLVSFNQLSADIQETNMDSARTIPRKLKLLGIKLQKSDKNKIPELLELMTDEIEKLAQWEHSRWNWQKIMQGWIYGPVKDPAVMTHPYILPWKRLSEQIQDIDRESIKLIPELIKMAGYEAVRG
jgi:hypothetical protein